MQEAWSAEALQGKASWDGLRLEAPGLTMLLQILLDRGWETAKVLRIPERGMPEIAPALRSNESLRYILTAENAGHTKVQKTSP